ncbi:MAG: outer membrane protein [Deltaproteobacteria bacterium]
MVTSHLKRILLGLILIVGSLGFSNETFEELKMKKRFGIGVTAAGPLSVLGLEIDINVNEEFSMSGGLGTGLDYSTFTLKGKYFLLGERVSPYIGGGVARWWTDGTRETNVGPSVLKNKFLSGNDFSDGFNVWMLYPALGVQYLHPSGVSLYAEILALFKLPSLANGTYAGLGALLYF